MRQTGQAKVFFLNSGTEFFIPETRGAHHFYPQFFHSKAAYKQLEEKTKNRQELYSEIRFSRQ